MPYEIRTIPTPSVRREHEILLKIIAASLCHTDRMVVEGKFDTRLPCTASPEGVGIVAAVGAQVANFKLGDRLMSGIMKGPCGKCYDCRLAKILREHPGCHGCAAERRVCRLFRGG